MTAIVLGLILTAAVSADDAPSLALADIKLPAPQTQGGPGIFEALSNRSSVLRNNNFPAARIKNNELSTILWAASGLNRPEKGWTVPMALGSPPYCSVYVVSADGVYLYDWKSHSLTGISAGDFRPQIPRQAFAATASHILVIVEDTEMTMRLARNNEQLAVQFGAAAAGAMTQNIYLAGDALGIGTRYIMQLNEPAVRTHLKLRETQRPICIMPLGYKTATVPTGD